MKVKLTIACAALFCFGTFLAMTNTPENTLHIAEMIRAYRANHPKDFSFEAYKLKMESEGHPYDAILMERMMKRDALNAIIHDMKAQGKKVSDQLLREQKSISDMSDILQTIETAQEMYRTQY